jgi:hypothetical protein
VARLKGDTVVENCSVTHEAEYDFSVQLEALDTALSLPFARSGELDLLKGVGLMASPALYLRRIEFMNSTSRDAAKLPWRLPAFRNVTQLDLGSSVVILVGENGL